MKLLVEPCGKKLDYISKIDGIILALKDYSVESLCFFTIDEITNIKKNNKCSVFVKINNNLFNDDISKIKDILIKLDNIGIDGIFFYDLAILQLKKELNLSIDLIWNQTHMVNNYMTCNYYYDKGVKYALLGKEITLDEIRDIINNSKIISMVEVVSLPSVAFSKRKLVSNYFSDLGESGPKEIVVQEKITKDSYNVVEDDNGTTFFLNKVTNGTSIISDLYKCGCKYIIFREYGIDNFNELISDTISYIEDGCIDDNYINKYRKLGDSTNFFFRKTIYKVK